jgi:hypothetical protein
MIKWIAIVLMLSIADGLVVTGCSDQQESSTAATDRAVAAVSADAPKRDVLPIPDSPFKGKIGLRPADSVKDFPYEATAPAGAPNVLLILTDDVGFGASSTFGGPIPTPTFDRLAAMGFYATTTSTPRRSAHRREQRC